MIEIKGEKYYSAREVAEKFSVEMNAVARWRKAGKLIPHQVSERKYMFSETALELFVRGGK